jgi:hypothetical protein
LSVEGVIYFGVSDATKQRMKTLMDERDIIIIQKEA